MSKLNEAAIHATNTTNAQFRDKINKLTNMNITELINQIKTSTLNEVEIKKLISEINVATDKNKKITELIERGGDVAKNLREIIGKMK